jgi:hypothetical protein
MTRGQNKKNRIILIKILIVLSFLLIQDNCTAQTSASHLNAIGKYVCTQHVFHTRKHQSIDDIISLEKDIANIYQPDTNIVPVFEYHKLVEEQGISIYRYNIETDGIICAQVIYTIAIDKKGSMCQDDKTADLISHAMHSKEIIDENIFKSMVKMYGVVELSDAKFIDEYDSTIFKAKWRYREFNKISSSSEGFNLRKMYEIKIDEVVEWHEIMYGYNKIDKTFRVKDYIYARFP